MKKITAAISIFLLLTVLCGCGSQKRVRLILCPSAEVGSEAVENSAEAYQNTVLPVVFPQLSGFSCVRVNENIQVDCVGEIKSQAALNQYIEDNFECAWLEAFSEDEELVFSSVYISSAEFETDEDGTEQLVISLNNTGTALFERATINHNKEKLLIYLDGVTLGECRMDKWIKNGKCRFVPDAMPQTEEEKQQLCDKIMSAAGLSCGFTVLYGSLL